MGDDDGVLIVDGTQIIKKGVKSVGGGSAALRGDQPTNQVENCQVIVMLASAWTSTTSAPGPRSVTRRGPPFAHAFAATRKAGLHAAAQGAHRGNVQTRARPCRDNRRSPMVATDHGRRCRHPAGRLAPARPRTPEYHADGCCGNRPTGCAPRSATTSDEAIPSPPTFTLQPPPPHYPDLRL